MENLNSFGKKHYHRYILDLSAGKISFHEAITYLKCCFNDIESRYRKPTRDAYIYATSDCPYCKAGETIGVVLEVKGKIVIFRNMNGELDSLIWKFKADSLNTMVEFGY